MRSFLFLSVLLSGLSLLVKATPIQLFQPTQIPTTLQTDLQKEVKAVSFFLLNENKLKSLYQSDRMAIDLEIPFENGGTKIVHLNRSEVTTSDFIIRTSGGKQYSRSFEKAIHFQGLVGGTTKSMAAFSFTSTQISGVFSFGTGNYNLVKLKTPVNGKDVYALFNDLDILLKNPFACHTDDLPDNKNATKGLIPKTTQQIEVDECRRVELYFECDHRMFLDNGSSVPNTVNFVASLFNVVSAIYAQTGVITRISETMVHTQPDDYPTASSSDALYAFVDSVSIRPPFNGDLAHLLSTVPNANGGIAFLDVLCSKGTGYSNIYPTFLPLPFYSWDVNVLTHELGHNFGSPHTQSCSWEISPGIYEMLDSCYTSEGGCYLGPRIASVGTQMSYCHLMNLGIDMSKGFGPLPGALILANYHGSSCLNGSVELPPLFVTKPDTFCSGTNVALSVTPVSGATYLWSGPNGFTSSISNPVLTNISPSQAGTYTVVVSKGGCSSSSQSTHISVNCIYVVPQTNRTLCLPGVFSVDYVASIQPGAGNVFSVQMSNAAGSFASPTVIGSIVSNQQKGNIPVALPNGFQPDSGFLLRVVSSSPSSIGLPNAQKLRFNPLPAEPVGADVTHCQPGIFQLSATGSGTISWYNSATSSTALATGPTFTTPALAATTSYWVSSQQEKKESIGHQLNFDQDDTLLVNNTYHGLFIKVKKNLIVDSITVYPNGPGVLRFNIKDSANTFIYKTVLVSVAGNIEGEKVKIGVEMSPGIYRVDAENSTIPGLLRLNNYFDFPLVSEGMDMLGASVGSRYYFFFDWKIRSFGCPSKRKEIKAIISGPPTSPTVQGAQLCGPGSLDLSASGALVGQSYRWYTLAVGGTAITGQTGSSYSTPSLTQTTTYYVSVFAAVGCESARVPVVATVNPLPNIPQAATKSICGPGSITLKATGASAGQSYLWYTVDLGGVPIANTTGDSLVTPALSSTTVYYVSILGAGNCEGSRVADTAKIKAIPDPPQVTGAVRCGPGQVTLTASGATGNNGYRWYTPPFVVIISSAASIIPNVFNTDTFYVQILGSNGCASPLQPVVAHVLSAPPMADLTVSGGYVIASIDTVYDWYRNGIFIGTFGDSLLNSAFGSGVYFAVIKRANGCVTQTHAILVTETADNLSGLPSVRVYPNPGSGIFTIETATSGQWQYQIFDYQGRKVEENQWTGSINQIDLQSVASGIYSLRIFNGRQQQLIRLRKE